MGLRDRYEAFHKAKITDEAIKKAVELSSRYITDRFQPDKAIDVIDEAAAKVRMEASSTPDDLKKKGGGSCLCPEREGSRHICSKF